MFPYWQNSCRVGQNGYFISAIMLPFVTWMPMDHLVHVVIEWPPIQGETRWKEKFHLYAMMAINHLMDGIKMQPECITPTLWQNVQTLVRATKYHLKGVPWVKASQLYVCIEPGFFAICSLYNIYQSRPTNTLRAYWMDGQFWTESSSF